MIVYRGMKVRIIKIWNKKSNEKIWRIGKKVEYWDNKNKEK